MFNALRTLKIITKYFHKLLFRNVSENQTIFKNTFWLILSEIVTKGLIVILVISIIRYLGAEKFGQFSFAFAFVTFFSVIADFGLTTLTIREVARNTLLGKKYIDNIIVIKLILGAVAFGAVVLSINFLDKTADIKLLVYLAGIWMIAQCFIKFFQSIFRAFEKMEYETLSKAVYSIALLIAAFYMMHLGLESVFLVQSYIFASVISIIITLFLIRKKFTKFWVEIDPSFWKKLLKEAWPLALFTVFAIIYFQISIIMLSIMKTDLDVGLYSIAFNSVTAFLLLIEIIAGSVFPALSKMVNGEALTKKLLVITMYLGLFLSIILYLGAAFFIRLLYGDGFAGAVSAFQIMVWILPLGFMNQIFTISLIAANLQKKRLNAAIVCAFFNILINLTLIPIFGLMGAAVATLLTELVLFFLYFAFYKNTIAAKERNKKIQLKYNK